MIKIFKLKKAIKREKDEAVRIHLILELNKALKNLVGFLLNGSALVLVVLGFCFSSSMPYLLVELHGALTGLFALGTIIHLKNARNNR